MADKHHQAAALHSYDVVAGLGAAPRDLLATCLALFEDSTLEQRLTERVQALREIGGKRLPSQADSNDQQPLSSLQQRIAQWINSPEADDALRLVLWMRLRQAFGLPEKTFGNMRSARTAAEDLVAAAVQSMQPGKFEAWMQRAGVRDERDVPDSLDALTRKTLAELMHQVMSSEDKAGSEALVRSVKERVAELDDESRERLLAAIDARELNDQAIRTILLTGGGLAAFGGTVGAAGFSAYILAAQASAFIPLVSGPALVSFVAVLSNPVTILLATAGAGVWATRSANKKIQSGIALRVISLMALTGIAGGDSALRAMARAFRELPGLRSVGELDDGVLVAYRRDWQCIDKAQRKVVHLKPGILQVMERPLPGSRREDRWDRLLEAGDGAVKDMAAMTALTLGELIYHLHALDPAVLAAADFSRVEDLSDPVAFATFAHEVESLGEASQLGAISNLKGYVAEQVVAAELVRQGHVVEFPATSNQEGWDLAVDGVKFQVKNAADLDALGEHFSKYDYPVLANSEVAQFLAKAAEEGRTPAWADQVHFVEGYSQEAVQQLTDQTLEAGDSMLHPHVPVFAMTLSAMRQWGRYSSGQVSGSQAVEAVLVNGAAGAGLAVLGNYAGVAIGLLVFGPAGALVLGSALPILSRTQVGRVKRVAEELCRGDIYEAWKLEVLSALAKLIDVLERELERKAGLLKKPICIQPGPAADYLVWRQDEDIRFLREVWQRLRAIKSELRKARDEKLLAEDVGARLLTWLSTCTLHPVAYQAELRAWLEALARVPTLGDDIKKMVKESWERAREAMREMRG